MKASEEQKNVKGTIESICLSPHGLPDGLFLDSGYFVDLHPHELKDADALKVGTFVTVKGQEKHKTILDHATVLVDGKIVSSNVDVKDVDDTVEGEVLHYLMEDDKVVLLTLTGNITVEVPHHEELDESKVNGMVKVEGKVRKFKDGSFVKAKKIKWLQ